MNNTSNARITADEIADMADEGQDISRFFTNNFEVVRASRSTIPVYLDLPTVQQLDLTAMELKLSRQDLIDRLLREFREQHQADTSVDAPQSTPAVAA